MEFQIINKNGESLTMSELNKDVAIFWNVEESKHYAEPNSSNMSWFEAIAAVVVTIPKGPQEWPQIIGKFCGSAAIGESSFHGIIESIEYYRPYIELCLHWKEKGYTLVNL